MVLQCVPFLGVAEQKGRTAVKMGLTKLAPARTLIEQSRAEQSRAEQSRAEQSRVSETLRIFAARIFTELNYYCKKDAVPAW